MKDQILKSLRQERALEGLIGKHRKFTDLIQRLKKVADKNVSVLLIGETGTGKGRCAELLHQYGSFYNGPFISYNCGSGPAGLFESQIFGHVRGAFTGAHMARPGLVEEADTGILFLDEINSLDPCSQVKLNHFLECGHFRRLGENRYRQSTVRIVSAANIDLRKEVKAGTFREDLYFRLAEYELHVPPLRRRKEDIVLLIQYFVKKNRGLSANGSVYFSPNALKGLVGYDWPGNIRELENFVKRCLIDANSSRIDIVNLPQSPESRTAPENVHLESLCWKEAKKQVVSTFEKNYLQTLLKEYNGIVAECARHAGIHPPDFWKLMRKYGLKADKYR